MPKLVVIGGHPLEGITAPNGSKNAAFPVLAASLLSSTSVVLDNIPDITDIRITIDILTSVGADVRRDGSLLYIDPTRIHSSDVPRHLGGLIRGSYYFLGALVARFGTATIPLPGGCKVGERPMDLHLRALESLGAKVSFNDDVIAIECDKLIGAYHRFPFPTRGGTINLLMAALRAQGETIIDNANYSPETKCLIEFVRSMGARITILDSTDYHATLKVVGEVGLIGSRYRIISDKIEAATLLLSGLITGGCVKVEVVDPINVAPFIAKMREIGFDVFHEDALIWLEKGSLKLNPVKVVSGLSSPSIDADWEPLIAAVLATMVPGKSSIQDEINPQRHSRFLPHFSKFGCDVEIESPTKAVILGGRQPNPANVRCEEIRGGAALLLLALGASGLSTLDGFEQVDRGYERLDDKLKRLGANIERVID